MPFNKSYANLKKSFNLIEPKDETTLDDPDKNLENKQSEVFSQCLHQNNFKVVNLMSCKWSNDMI